jgi:hypothetical protein
LATGEVEVGFEEGVHGYLNERVSKLYPNARRNFSMREVEISFLRQPRSVYPPRHYNGGKEH